MKYSNILNSYSLNVVFLRINEFYSIASSIQKDSLFGLFNVPTNPAYECSNEPSRNTLEGCNVLPHFQTEGNEKNTISLILFNPLGFVIDDYEVKITAQNVGNVDVVDEANEQHLASQIQLLNDQRVSKISFNARLPPLAFSRYTLSYQKGQISLNDMNSAMDIESDPIISNSHFKVSFVDSAFVIRNRLLSDADIKLQIVMFNKADPKSMSGAYLSKIQEIPQVIDFESGDVKTINGDVYSSIVVKKRKKISVEIKLARSTALMQQVVQIEIKTDLTSKTGDDVDIAMRITNLNNYSLDRVLTDSNGYMMVTRRRHQHLPSHANIYPFTRSVCTQLHDNIQLNVLSSSPRSVHLPLTKANAIDIILDRISSRDDARGMEEPLINYHVATHKFHLFYESVSTKRSNLGMESFESPICSSVLCDQIMKRLTYSPLVSVMQENVTHNLKSPLKTLHDNNSDKELQALPHVVLLTQLMDTATKYRFLLVLEANQHLNTSKELFIHNFLFGRHCNLFAYSSLTGKVKNSNYFDCSTQPLRLTEFLTAVVFTIPK